MGEKAVIIHKSVIEEWGRRQNPPLTLSSIQRALKRINEVIKTTKPENVILVEQSPDTGFTFLPGKVGAGNTVRLYGTRAGHCLKIARNVLEDSGIQVSIDNEGSLP